MISDIVSGVFDVFFCSVPAKKCLWRPSNEWRWGSNVNCPCPTWKSTVRPPCICDIVWRNSKFFDEHVSNFLFSLPNILRSQLNVAFHIFIISLNSTLFNTMTFPTLDMPIRTFRLNSHISNLEINL